MKIEIHYPKLFIDDKLVGYLKAFPKFYENYNPKTTYRGRPEKKGANFQYGEDNPFYNEQFVCEVNLLDDKPESLIEKVILPHKLEACLSIKDKEKIPKPKNRKIKV